MLNIYGETSKIVINGKEYLGQHVEIKDGKIIVDNVLQEQSANTGNISVKVYGNVSYNVTTTSGDVHCRDVRGGVETISGDVNCSTVYQDIHTVSGSISYKKE